MYSQRSANGLYCAVKERTDTEMVILEKQSLLQMEQPDDKRDRPQVVGNTDDEETDPLARRQNPRRGAGSKLWMKLRKLALKAQKETKQSLTL